MTKKEFLEELRIALQGEVSQSVVNENLNYYDNYIMEESRKGKTEEEVVEMLGSARLIAKTIIDLAEQPYANNGQTYYEEEDSMNHAGDEYSRKKGFHMDFDEKNGWDIGFGRFKINSWYGTILLIAIIVLIFYILFHVAIALIPIVMPIILVVFLVSYFMKRR